MKTLTPIGLNALKEASRRHGVVAIPFLVNHLVEMGYLQEEEWKQKDDLGDGTEVVTTAAYLILPRGRELLKAWDIR